MSRHRAPHPDSNYGWVVVMAAFLAHLFTHGIIYSFGILFIALEDRFQGSKAEIATIPSLTSGCLYLIGPVGSVLIRRYGCRVVTAIGAIVSSIGFIISMFVSHLYVLYVTIGFIGGCGLGLVFLSAIVIVTGYLPKYRTLAMGLALSGAGSGAFVFSPLLDRLLEIFSLQGTLMLISGILLNCIPCGLMFRSPEDVNASMHEIHVDDTGEKNIKVAIVSMRRAGGLDEDKQSDTNIVLREQERQLDHDTLTKITKSDDIGPMDNGGFELAESSEIDQHENRTNDAERNPPVDTEITEIQLKVKVSHEENVLGFDRKRTIEKETTFQRHWTLYRSPRLFMFFFSQVLFFSAFLIPFLYLPDKANEHGITERDAAWMTSAIGLSSIFGRVVLGYLADTTSLDRLMLFRIAILVSGTASMIVPLFTTFLLLIGYAVVYGSSTGIVLILTPVVLLETAGSDLLSDSMGINNLFSAIGSFIGPPLIGLIYDWTGNYTAPFLATGIVLSLSSILLFMTKCSSRQ